MNATIRFDRCLSTWWSWLPVRAGNLQPDFCRSPARRHIKSKLHLGSLLDGSVSEHGRNPALS